MKIKPDHLATLASAISPLDTTDRRSAYRAGDIPRAASVKDMDMRYRCDLYGAAIITLGWDFQECLYAYLNDAHIDTALRSIVAPLGD